MPLGAPTAGIAKSGFSIELDRSDILKVEALLSGVKNGASRVIVRAVNKTLAGVRTDTVNEIREGVNVMATAIRKTMRIDNATVSRMSAKVTSRQKYGTNLAAFGARQTKKGVTVNVIRRTGRKLIPHAFIVGKGSKRWVAWRGTRDEMSPYVGTQSLRTMQWAKNRRSGGFFETDFHYGALPRKYRLPISKRWGPAIPDLMKHVPTFDAIERKAKARLDKNFSHELDYMLSKL